MLCRDVIPATRRIAWLVMLLALAGPGLSHAATPGEPTTVVSPAGQPVNRKPAPEHVVTHPVRHPGHREALKPTPHPTAGAHGVARGGAVPPIANPPAAGEPKPGATAPAAPAQPPAKPPAGSASAEPGEPAKIPRFAALKTDDTNMRKGPGQRYPIEWVYKRHDLPMEVEREYDVWRYVRDPDGIEGWVHQVTLSDRRTFLVQGKDATLRADPKETANPVATLKAGVIGRLQECAAGSDWCHVKVGGFTGYLRRDQFWGLLPNEVLAPS